VEKIPFLQAVTFAGVAIIGDIACRDSSQGLQLWFLTVPDWSAVTVIVNMSVCGAAAVIVNSGWEECWSCDCWQCLECCICDCWQCLDWGIQLWLLTVPGWGCWNCEIILLHVSWFDSCQCAAGSMPFCSPPPPIWNIVFLLLDTILVTGRVMDNYRYPDFFISYKSSTVS
jgi:hypothetical protein